MIIRRNIRNIYKDILGMSEPRKTIGMKLSHDSGPVMDHLVKLYCYPDNQNRGHWIDEIYSFIRSVPKQKNNNKYPDVTFIMKHTYYVWEDSIDDKINKILDNYGDITWTDEKSIDFHHKAYTYFKLLAEELHAAGSVTRKEVEIMIENSGF